MESLIAPRERYLAYLKCPFSPLLRHRMFLVIYPGITALLDPSWLEEPSLRPAPLSNPPTLQNNVRFTKLVPPSPGFLSV